MTPRARPIRHIIEMVAAEFHMTAELLLDKRGDQPIPAVRNIALLVTREALEGDQRSYGSIANAVQRHHTTIMNAVGQARKSCIDSPWHRATVDRLIERARSEIFGSSATVENEASSSV